MPKEGTRLLDSILRWGVRRLVFWLKRSPNRRPASSLGSQSTPVQPDRSGPPEHWLEKVRRGAPHLLQSAPGIEKGQSAIALGEDLRPASRAPDSRLSATNAQPARSSSPHCPPESGEAWGPAPGGSAIPLNFGPPAVDLPAIKSPTVRTQHAGIDPGRAKAARLLPVAASPAVQQSSNAESSVVQLVMPLVPSLPLSRPVIRFRQPGSPAPLVRPSQPASIQRDSDPDKQSACGDVQTRQRPSAARSPADSHRNVFIHVSPSSERPAATVAPSPDRWPTLPSASEAPLWGGAQQLWNEQERRRYLAAEQGGSHG